MNDGAAQGDSLPLGVCPVCNVNVDAHTRVMSNTCEDRALAFLDRNMRASLFVGARPDGNVVVMTSKFNPVTLDLTSVIDHVERGGT